MLRSTCSHFMLPRLFYLLLWCRCPASHGNWGHAAQHTSRALHPPIPPVIFIVTLYLKKSYWPCAMKCLTWYDELNGARVYCQIEGCDVERTKEQACRASTLHRCYELHYNFPLLTPSIPFLEGKGGTLSCVAACAITLLSCEMGSISSVT